MKFKVFYFLLPLLTAAMLFTFCTIESQVVPQDPTEEVNQGVSDRTKCLVTVSVNSGAVSVCGTNTLVSACSILPNGETLRGVENLVAPIARIYGVQTADGPTNDGFMTFTNLAPAPAVTSVTVTTNTGSITFNVGAAPVTVTINSNCVPF